MQSERRSHRLPREGLIPDAPVQRLVYGDLVAFVSALPEELYGESALQASFTDLDGLRDRVIAHNRVVAELRRSCDILPFRFCTIYRDAGHVANALAEHRDAMWEAFDRVLGASEWAMKLYCDRAALGSLTEAQSGAVRQLQGALGDASPGARFFLQKRYDRTLDGEIDARIAGCVERAHQCLAGCVRETVEVPLQSAEVHGRAEEMVMHAACLVDEQSLDRFQQIIDALRKEHAGFVFQVTGPWPPYHFVSTRQEGFDAAASHQ
jgi:hypothetical protein